MVVEGKDGVGGWGGLRARQERMALGMQPKFFIPHQPGVISLKQVGE